MKALSPLVSVVLLIAIAVLIATLIGGWLTSVTKQQTLVAGARSASIGECLISIEAVYLNPGNAKILVQSLLANDTLTSALLVDNTGTIYSPTTTLPDLEKGKIEEIIISGSPTCSEFSQAIVTGCATVIWESPVKPTNCP